MNRTQTLRAREVLDSRGVPTLEVEIQLGSGVMTRAAVPSGNETPGYGSVFLRDNDPDRYFGQGVLQAVTRVNETIAPALLGKDVEDQEVIDEQLLELDGNIGMNPNMTAMW